MVMMMVITVIMMMMMMVITVIVTMIWRRLGHEDMVFLESRRNKRFDEQCDSSSS